jgi:hypothetical protein
VSVIVAVLARIVGVDQLGVEVKRIPGCIGQQVTHAETRRSYHLGVTVAIHGFTIRVT